jgi:hypothetical protein
MLGACGRTTPSECALAFALPRTREQFIEDLRAGPAKDFASHLTERDPERVRKAEVYASSWYDSRNGVFGLTDVIADVLGDARANGVTVVEDAALAGFAGLFDLHAVVTLVSHWKPHNVLPDDVIDWPGLARRLTPSGGGILGWVAERLSPEVGAILAEHAPTPPRSRQELFLDELTKVLESERYSAPLQGDGRLPAERLLNGFHNRNALDAALTAELRPGNRAEFRDGLYPAGAVAARVPDSFTGTLDLTVCNSVFLAEAIKGSPAKRGSLILANRDPTPVKLRLLLYKYVIREVARTNSDYRDTVRHLRSKLLFREP